MGRPGGRPLPMNDVLLTVGATTMFAFANLLRSASEVVVARGRPQVSHTKEKLYDGREDPSPTKENIIRP